MIKKKSKIIEKPLLYIDLLGFSASIKSQPLKDSLLFYEQFLYSLKSMHEVHNKLRFTFVSDSALLWINGSNSAKNIEELFEVAFSLLHNSLLIEDESIRGAIVFDEFEISDHQFTLGKTTISSPIIIGKAIISAYTWEQSQNWMGISINPNYIKKFSDCVPELMSKLEKERVLNKYNVPTKSGYVQTMAIGVHESHISGKICFKNKAKKQFIKVDQIWNVNSYYDVLAKKKNKQLDFGVLSKITETENYIRYLEKQNWGKQYNWESPFETTSR